MPSHTKKKLCALTTASHKPVGSFFIHFIVNTQTPAEQRAHFNVIFAKLKAKSRVFFLNSELSWSALSRLCVYQIILLNQKAEIPILRNNCFFLALVWKSCAFLQLWSSPASVLICWNDKQCSWGWNNEGPSEGLISPAQVHPSSGIASCGGEWEWRQGEGGLKWFVTWFCGLLGVFLLTSSLPWGLVFAVVCSKRGGIGFPPLFFQF